MGGCVTSPSQPNHVNLHARAPSPQRYSSSKNIPIQTHHQPIQRSLSPIKQSINLYPNLDSGLNNILQTPQFKPTVPINIPAPVIDIRPVTPIPIIRKTQTYQDVIPQKMINVLGTSPSKILNEPHLLRPNTPINGQQQKQSAFKDFPKLMSSLPQNLLSTDSTLKLIQAPNIINPEKISIQKRPQSPSRYDYITPMKLITTNSFDQSQTTQIVTKNNEMLKYLHSYKSNNSPSPPKNTPLVNQNLLNMKNETINAVTYQPTIHTFQYQNQIPKYKQKMLV